MFLTLLGCGIALLAAFLGMLDLPRKPIRICISVMGIICIAFLILAIITENPFAGKNRKCRSEDDLKSLFNAVDELVKELEMEEMHFYNASWKVDIYAQH
jgi:hypothetical protein